MTVRIATLADCPLLAEMNHKLIRDEGHGNTMTIPGLTSFATCVLAVKNYD